MNLAVKRHTRTPHSTIGDLSVDSVYECKTLEDVERAGPKVFGETAIPTGTYTVVVTFSNRFQKRMPLLEKVPGFEGIRIHSGNVAADTHGCILVGQKAEPDKLVNSRLAYDALFAKIDAAWARQEPITLTVVA